MTPPAIDHVSPYRSDLAFIHDAGFGHLASDAARTLSAALRRHGLTGHAWEFDRVASTLTDRFRVLAVNQRGHGASSWADAYSPESWQTMWPHSSTHWTSAACESSVTRWEASTVDG